MRIIRIMKLDYLDLFLLIVQKGSLAAAGRELGLSPTTVSERLASIERYYGVTLLNRTTRSISLTEEGRILAEGAQNILVEHNDLNSRIRHGAQTLSGFIRVSAPVDLGNRVVRSIIDSFLIEHPAISIELCLSDGYLNIIEDGIDIAIRYGNLEDSSLRVRKLGQHHRIVCASPEYIEQYGSPQTPAQLINHNCLVMRFGMNLDNNWQFWHKGKREQVSVNGNRIANDGRLVRSWVIAGYGIALKSKLDIAPELDSGILVELLGRYAASPIPIQMLFPPSRTQPQRVKELADELVTRFNRNPFA